MENLTCQTSNPDMGDLARKENDPPNRSCQICIMIPVPTQVEHLTISWVKLVAPGRTLEPTIALKVAGNSQL